MLLSFTADTSFDRAKEIISSKGFLVQDEAGASVNFSETHRLMVSVPEGKELTAVCAFRREASIKYAGVNEIFELHE